MTAIDRMAAASFRYLTIISPVEPQQVSCFAVSERYFDVLGARPSLGRAFTRADYDTSLAHWAQHDTAKPRANPVLRVMILSHAMWQREFRGRHTVVGREVVLSGGDRVEIIGVMQAEVGALAFALPGHSSRAIRARAFHR